MTSLLASETESTKARVDPIKLGQGQGFQGLKRNRQKSSNLLCHMEAEARRALFARPFYDKREKARSSSAKLKNCKNPDKAIKSSQGQRLHWFKWKKTKTKTNERKPEAAVQSWENCKTQTRPSKAPKVKDYTLVELGTKWKSLQQMIIITMIHTPPTMMINVPLMTIILITSAVPPKAHFPIVVTSQNIINMFIINHKTSQELPKMSKLS